MHTNRNDAGLVEVAMTVAAFALCAWAAAGPLAAAVTTAMVLAATGFRTNKA